MTFATLALIVAVGLIGPLIAALTRWRVALPIGELAAGILLGTTGTGTLDPTNDVFRFLADVGFALVMFFAGSHVPVRQVARGAALRVGALRAGLTAAMAIPVGIG